MTHGPPDIAFIPVSYCDPDNIRRLTDSVAAQRSGRLLLLVVDNCPESQEEELGRILEAADVESELVRPGENLNYWRGARYGVDALRHRCDDMPEWTVIMNSDVAVAETFAERLLAVDGARYSVVAPRVVRHADGEEQNPFMLKPLSRMRRLYWWLYGRGYWVAKGLTLLRDLWRSLPRGKRAPGSARSQTRRVIYAPHGACVCFHRSYFHRGGYIDNEFEMYAEELSVGAITEELGMNVLYEPAVEAVHFQSQRRLGGVNRHRYELARESYRQFIRKHG